MNQTEELQYQDTAAANRDFLRQLLVLLVAGFFIVFLFNGRRAVYDTSESRYAEAARGMAMDGHWIVPRIFGVPHLTKPPLAYWLIALPMTLFGTSEWAARLSSGLAFLATALVCADFGRVLWRNRAAGILAGWFMLLSIIPLGAAHVVTTDVFVSMFELMGCWSLWRGLRAEQHTASAKRARWVVATWAAFAAAFLTKGPPALLPLLPILVFAIIRRKRFSWKIFLSVKGVVAALAIAVPWYAFVGLTVPAAREVWFFETVHRLAIPDKVMSRWVYVAELTLGALPGSAALMYLARPKVAGKQEDDPHSYDAGLFLGLWFVLPFLVFFIAKQRLYLYVLPLFCPVAIAAGRAAQQRWFRDAGFRAADIPRWALVTATIVALTAPAARYFYGLDEKRLESIAPKLLAGNFRPMAREIAADAAKHGVRAHLVIAMPEKGFGLAYYLNGPPVDVLTPGTAASMARGIEGERRSLRQALRETMAQPVASGEAQYLITSDPLEGKKLGKEFSPYFTVVAASGGSFAYRRITNTGVQLSMP